MKQVQKTKRYLMLVVIAVICIALFTVIILIKTNNAHSSSRQGKITVEEIEKLPEAAPEIKISEETPLGKAKAENIEAVAWLQIPETEIDNAVMQTANNDYYLFRDERGEKNQWGSFFADYYANLTSPENLIQNTVIYGHTESQDNPEGQRFSQLFKYTDLDVITTNRNIYLTLGEDKLTFEIFAVFYSDIDFYYIDPNPSDQGFDSFMQEIGARNEYIFEGTTVTEKDKLLTLSGCAHKYDVNKTGNHRIVVMAKLLTDDSVSQVTTIRPNPSPQRPAQ